MLIVFRSKAGADVLMLGAQAQEVLRALGREPADQGIFRGDQIPEALRHLAATLTGQSEAPEAEEDDAPQRLGLQARAWPVRSLLAAAQALGADVTWSPA